MRQSEFEDIAERIRLKAVKIASSMSVGDDEAEDIAQEVMLSCGPSATTSAAYHTPKTWLSA